MERALFSQAAQIAQQQIRVPFSGNAQTGALQIGDGSIELIGATRVDCLRGKRYNDIVVDCHPHLPEEQVLQALVMP